jgi:acyl-coenzyme A synthetase/AMP-(fatty) acid ligase
MEFVADIPLAIDHPSRATLDGVAEGLALLSNVPVLLIWGMRDPVFSPRYLDDLRRRLPHAQVQQFDDAGHLVLEDRPDAIEQIWQWIHKQIQSAPSHSSKVSDSDSTHMSNLVGKLHALKGSSAAAVTEPSNGSWRSVSWALLDDRVRRVTSGLQARGVKPGDRVALLVPPGADLLALVYALWSVGAVIVVVDAANGPRALWRSLRGARIDHVVAIKRARPIVVALRVPGVVVWSNELAELAEAVDVASPETGASESGSVSDDADAAIVFTSGATGPAKPVAYSRQRIAATRDVLLEHFAFTSADVLVAAFAPWAVLGPLLGISSVIPQMDASRPGSLTADALSTAMEQAGGTIMWMSPAALRSVLSGAGSNTQARERLKMAGAHLRLVMIAGAPVSRELLRDLMDLWPQADVRTPYGMTEVLPATDVSAAEVLADSTDRGVLVGRALPGVDVAIAALGAMGEPGEDLQTTPDVLGEVALRAQHAKSRYDGRAFVEGHASRNEGWHRTGDVGMLDAEGRLWIQGRLSHVITGPRGPLGPVPMEQQVERALVSEGVGGVLVAAVGVGPAGSQVPVVVCAPSTVGRSRSDLRLADAELVDRVRAVLPDVAAVLWRSAMPVDIRHGAKIDRQKLAQEAATFLEGRS